VEEGVDGGWNWSVVGGVTQVSIKGFTFLLLHLHKLLQYYQNYFIKASLVEQNYKKPIVNSFIIYS
jgi:hypothetical protein